MNLLKITTIIIIVFNVSIIPLYLIMNYIGFYVGNLLWTFLYLVSYVGAVSIIILVCFLAVRIRSGFKGTRLMIGNRHLHEGTIGISMVLIGIIWNIWHWFDPLFHTGNYYMFGWIISIGGLIWIVIGAVLIGRDWEDIKKGRFFNKEEE
ncbi:MAG: hypothetical protein ACFFD2_14510 [Promethearchaeota archaeon]